MSLKVEGLSKIYGEQKAVDHISFEVKKGEILGFLGPNGAGKSTTMKMITGFVEPSAGRVLVCGEDPVVAPLKTKAKIGYLPEHNPLYLEMYVKEYLSFIANVHGLKNVKDKVRQIIALVGLDREQGKKIGALSKGYRQRVGLAQALIHDPEVLILDEPTTGLDPNQIVEIRDLIKEVSKNKTVLFSSHIMQEVQALCDKVVILGKGKMIANQTVDGLIKGNSLEKVFLQFDAGTTVEDAFFESLPYISSVERLTSLELIVALEGEGDQRARLFKDLVAQGLVLLEMRRVEKNMEQIFQSITKD